MFKTLEELINIIRERKTVLTILYQQIIKHKKLCIEKVNEEIRSYWKLLKKILIKFMNPADVCII